MPYSQVFEPLQARQPHLRPIEAIVGACSQSPEWLDDAGRSLASSTSHWALDWSKDACFVAIKLSQALWMCCLLLAGRIIIIVVAVVVVITLDRYVPEKVLKN